MSIFKHALTLLAMLIALVCVAIFGLAMLFGLTSSILWSD